MTPDSDGKGMGGGSYVSPASDPVRDARDFLKRVFRREGFDTQHVHAATEAYLEELVELLTGPDPTR